MNQQGGRSCSGCIALIGLLAALISAVAAVVVIPEVRCMLGLEDSATCDDTNSPSGPGPAPDAGFTVHVTSGNMGYDGYAHVAQPMGGGYAANLNVFVSSTNGQPMDGVYVEWGGASYNPLVSGLTSPQGMFSGEWRCQPCANAYVGTPILIRRGSHQCKVYLYILTNSAWSIYNDPSRADILKYKDDRYGDECSK